MTVREFLKLWADNIDVKVYQVPIKEIDRSSALVCRQIADVATLLDSNQNYLDFNIVNLQMDDDLPCVVCKADDEQSKKTIGAHLYRRSRLKNLCSECRIPCSIIEE